MKGSRREEKGDESGCRCYTYQERVQMLHKSRVRRGSSRATIEEEVEDEEDYEEEEDGGKKTETNERTVKIREPLTEVWDLY